MDSKVENDFKTLSRENAESNTAATTHSIAASHEENASDSVSCSEQITREKTTGRILGPKQIKKL
uniref:Uncharacterized protein n=1 Tax=Oryza glumipatula TaxID=40148 RepID=A0A0D9ZVN0_9ORYZ